MTNKEAFLYAVEKAGIRVQYYMDTNDKKYYDEVISYIRAATILLEKIES